MVGLMKRINHILATTIAVMSCAALYFGCAGDDETETLIGPGCPEAVRDTMIIPTAGLEGVTLTPGQELVFQIDKKRTRKPLFWDDLVRRFPDAWVQITVEINCAGDIVRWVDRKYELNRAAFDMIWDAVRTWKFTPCTCEGEMCYIFNTRSSEVIIDRSNMHPVRGKERCPITIGQLHRVYRKDRTYRFTPMYGSCQ